MRISNILGYLKYAWQFIPFRFNFIIYLLITFAAWRWMQTQQASTSSFAGIISLMIKVAFVFSVLILIVNFLSVLSCYIIFIIKKKNSANNAVEIKMNVSSKEKNQLNIQTRLPFALKPLLGYVKAKLTYDHTHYTHEYIISDRIKKQFLAFNTGLLGNNELILPDIKQYHFSKAIISFEDMLRFFRFSASAEVQNTIVNLPVSLLTRDEETSPKNTEEEKIRIEQLRKVEGEYLNYKKFEDADDVRRIVWKIFAKNKELVVRIPEIMDPFTSHVYMYASFYNQQNFNLHHAYHQAMSNRFKNCVWTIFDTLQNKELAVQYQSDQTIHHNAEEKLATKFTIALSTWHHDKTLTDYFKPKKGSVLCIHSLTNTKELATILSQCDEHTTIFFMQLSNIFKSYYLINWIMRIFFKPSPDLLTSLRNKWALHPLKFQTLQQEKVILAILKKSNINFEII